MQLVSAVQGSSGWVPIDPYDPIGIRTDDNAGHNQRNRRARILARAREQMAQRGFAGVSVKKVAALSDVSIQTIYNLVGDKSAMLGTATGEYIWTLALEACARPGYPCRIFALADGYAEATRVHRAFIREANLSYYPPLRPLRDAIYRSSLKATRHACADLRERGAWRPDVNVDELAASVMLGWGVFSLDCLTGDCDIEGLRYRMLMSARQHVIGAVCDDEALAIDRWFDRQGWTVMRG